MAYYGRYSTTGDTDTGVISALVQRECVFDQMSENGWGHTFHFWGGKPSSGATNPTVKPFIHAADASKNPSDRLAYANSVTVSAVMTDGASGAHYSAPVANVNASFSPGSNAVKLVAGKRYALGLLPTNATLDHGMTAAANIPGADNKNFYERSGISTPADPSGYTSSSYEGWITVAIEYQANRKPVAATSGPAGTVTSAAPTFTGTFTDSDSTYGDKMKAYQIQVVDADFVTMWDTGTVAATSAEAAAAAFSKAYGGSALTLGDTYQWRCRVQDQHSTWSTYTAFQSFTPAPAGTLTLTGFSGKQETRTPGPFTATWAHAASLKADHAQARILQGGTVAQTGAEFALAAQVAVGGTVSLAWADAGLATLAWGISDYSYEFRARDTAGTWTDWYAAAFSTNAAPGIPTGLSPANSKAESSRPVLSCVVVDADDSDATGLIVKARIKNNAGTVLQTRTMTKASASGDSYTFTYQTTSGDLASTGTYKWDAYAYDGTLYSGEQTVEASASKSAEATFVYANGPAIAHVVPTSGQVITTDTPTWQWTTTFSGGATQASRRSQIHRASDDALMYDTGVIADTASSFTQPGGKLVQDDYYIRHTIVDTNGLTGVSSDQPFTLAYTAPDAITGFAVSPQYVQYDREPSGIRLTWTASADPNFAAYLIDRRETGQDAADAEALAEIASAAATSWTDYFPPSGKDLTYSIRQATTQGLETTTSDRTEAAQAIALEHVVICSATDPATYRVVFTVDDSRDFDFVDDVVFDLPWGEATPVAAYGSAQYKKFSGVFKIVDDVEATADAYAAAAEALWQSRATFCYRDDRKRKFFAKFGGGFKLSDKRGGVYILNATIVQVASPEGVTA